MKRFQVDLIVAFFCQGTSFVSADPGIMTEAGVSEETR